MTSRDWLEKAKREEWAMGAFNVGNLETFKAVVQAASNKKSPIIVESSPGETSFLGADNIIDLAKNYSQEFNIPILVNLDHAESLEDCLKGIEAGYDLIHFDGSKLPYEENVKIARQVVEAAHVKGLLVEGELDHIAGLSEVHQDSAQSEIENIPMTDPEKAARFISDTGIDILAVFVGNVHGVYQAGDEHLNLELLKNIAASVNCFLSLHGGSGIPGEEIKQAIENGIVKVNINTEMRQAFKETLIKTLAQNPDEVAMYKIETPVMEEVQRVVEQKIIVFGSAGKLASEGEALRA